MYRVCDEARAGRWDARCSDEVGQLFARAYEGICAGEPGAFSHFVEATERAPYEYYPWARGRIGRRTVYRVASMSLLALTMDARRRGEPSWERLDRASLDGVRILEKSGWPDRRPVRIWTRTHRGRTPRRRRRIRSGSRGDPPDRPRPCSRPSLARHRAGAAACGRP